MIFKKSKSIRPVPLKLILVTIAILENINWHSLKRAIRKEKGTGEYCALCIIAWLELIHAQLRCLNYGNQGRLYKNNLTLSHYNYRTFLSLLDYSITDTAQ